MRFISVATVCLLAASSGNAGYAVAFVAKHLGVRSTIYLHVGVSENTVQLLESVDARVVVVGNTYQEALREAEKEAEADEHAYVQEPRRLCHVR